MINAIIFRYVEFIVKDFRTKKRIRVIEFLVATVLLQ